MKEFPRASVKVAVLYGFKSTPDMRQFLAVMGKSLDVNAKEDFLDFKVVSRNGCTPFDDTSLCVMATGEGLGRNHCHNPLNRPALSIFLERFGELT